MVDKILKRVTDLFALISIFSLIVVILVNFYEIINRYFFSKSLFWIQDFTQLCMMWFIFLGVTKMTYENQDILIDIFVSKMPRTIRRIIKTIVNVIIALFSALMSYEAYRFMLSNWTKDMMTSGIPTRYYIVTMIICFTVLCLMYFNKAYRELKKFNKGGAEI